MGSVASTGTPVDSLGHLLEAQSIPRHPILLPESLSTVEASVLCLLEAPVAREGVQVHGARHPILLQRAPVDRRGIRLVSPGGPSRSQMEGAPAGTTGVAASAPAASLASLVTTDPPTEAGAHGPHPVVIPVAKNPGKWLLKKLPSSLGTNLESFIDVKDGRFEEVFCP